MFTQCLHMQLHEHVLTKVKSRSVVSNSLRPHGLQHTRLLRPRDFPGKNTGVGCHFLLQKNNQIISIWLPGSRQLFPGSGPQAAEGSRMELGTLRQSQVLPLWSVWSWKTGFISLRLPVSSSLKRLVPTYFHWIATRIKKKISSLLPQKKTRLTTGYALTLLIRGSLD